jgi:hypothetical protein
MGSNKTIRLSTWLPPPYGSRVVHKAAEIDVAVKEKLNGSEEVTNDSKDHPENPALLTRACFMEVLARSANTDGGPQKVKDAVSTLADLGITVEIEKMKELENP